MAYTCPSCGQKAQRCGPKNSRSAAIVGGMAGVLLSHAFTFRFQCRSCGGQFKLSEMPSGTGGKVLLGTLGALAFAVALIVGVIWLILSMN